MHAVIQNNGEIILRYDKGYVTHYKSQHQCLTLKITKVIKQILFSNIVTLNKKIEMIENMFKKNEENITDNNS